MPGLTGPPAKREAERRRVNKTTESGASNQAEHMVAIHELLEDPYLVWAPAPNPEWHELATMHYWAARKSAIREYYEPSDWAALFLTLEQMSRWLNPQMVMVQSGENAGELVEMVVPMPGGVLSSIMKSLGALMFMEGDRRKLRLEIERVSGAAKVDTSREPTGDNVIQIRKDRLGGTAS